MEMHISKSSSILHSTAYNPVFGGGMKYLCAHRAVERLILLYGYGA